MGMKKSGAVFVRRDLILLLPNPLGGLWRPRGCDGAGGRKREPRWLFVGLLLGKCFSCKDGRRKWAPIFHFSREAGGGGYWYWRCVARYIPSRWWFSKRNDNPRQRRLACRFVRAAPRVHTYAFVHDRHRRPFSRPLNCCSTVTSAKLHG